MDTFKQFWAHYGSLTKMILLIVLCILPTVVLLFYQNRAFIDIGLLLTSILFVAFILPINKQRKKFLENRKKVGNNS